MSSESPCLSNFLNLSKENSQSAFNTPFKTNNNQGESRFAICDNTPPGSSNRTIHNSSGIKCKSEEKCRSCSFQKQLLNDLHVSPSTNYLYLSPCSFGKLFESFSRERINMIKLVTNNEYQNIKKDNKCDNNYIRCTHSPNLASQIFEKNEEAVNFDNNLTKKNLNTIFDKNDVKTKQIDDGYINHQNFNEFNYYNMLQKKTERDENEAEVEYEFIRKESMSGFSFKEKIMMSPKDEKPEKNYSEVKNWSTNKKKIFQCSDQKDLNLSNVKSTTTLHSTEKKEKKRLRKSSDQLKALKDLYNNSASKEWNKEIISEFSSEIGLPENKIYKWLWDKKNKVSSEKKLFYIQNGNSK
jgi:hypothetical protein